MRNFIDIVERFNHSFLVEMNVMNIDPTKVNLHKMISHLSTDKHIPKPTLDLLSKRLLKAIQNDDNETMVHKSLITQLDDNAPAWLQNALQRHEEVYEVNFRDDFETKLSHVIDWLATDQNAIDKIRTLPENDYLSRLYRTADEFFEQQNKLNSQEIDNSIEESGTEVIMTFRNNNSQIKEYRESDLEPNENGVVISFWRKLLSAESLNREGQLMSHCVGSYANQVKSESIMIYSLRDMKNQPHATIEIKKKGNELNQVKGKGNRPPLGKYSRYIKDFLNVFKVKVSSMGEGDLRSTGLFFHEGQVGSILDIPTIIDANFPKGDTIRHLPNKNDEYYYVEKDGTIPFRFSDGKFTEMRIEKSKIGIYRTNLLSFREENNVNLGDIHALNLFYVNGKYGNVDDYISDYIDNGSKGNLDLSSCISLTSLPKRLTVGGNLYINGCTSLTSLPEGLKVFDLDCTGCTSLTSLPEGLTIGRDLDCTGCTSLTSLPKRLTVGGNLSLYGTSLTSLPDGLEVGRNLSLNGTSLTSLPKGLTIGRDLDCTGCTSLTSLSKGLTVGRDLYLNGCTSLTSLPKGLTIGRDLYLIGCTSLILPKNLDNIVSVSGKITLPGKTFG